MEFGIITTTNKKSLKDTFMKVLSVIGGIAILAAVAWVGMQGFRVLPNARTLVANAVVSVQSFFSASERIVISAVDSQIVVEEPFVLTWEHRGKDTDGSYTFFYECRDGVHLALDGDTLFCNTEFPILSTDNSLTLTPHGLLVGVIDIPVEVRFRENGETTISERGEGTLTVQDVRFDDAAATSTAPSTETPATGGVVTPVPGIPTTQTIPVIVTPTSDPNGFIDLRVEVLAYGLVDKDTGVFQERDEIPRDLPKNKRGAIKFVVENIGTKASGEWEFEAELPTSPSYTYKSKDQQSLFPGDKIEFVIGFDRIKNDTEDDYRIEVDPKDDIDESKENNNVVNGTIEIDR